MSDEIAVWTQKLKDKFPERLWAIQDSGPFDYEGNVGPVFYQDGHLGFNLEIAEWKQLFFHLDDVIYEGEEWRLFSHGSLWAFRNIPN